MLQLLYSQFVRARRRYYERRPQIRRRLASPVISVGNLTVGGSGKTPLVAEIARMLLDMGERPAILSRGYGRVSNSDGVVIVSDGKELKTDVAHAGDEPYMLARAVPGVAVVVCGSRYVAGRIAEQQLGTSVHLLDDGFQHLRLMRDIDLLVAAPDDFDDVRTLPFGRFREPVDAARAADAVLVAAAAGTTPAQVGERLNVQPAFGFDRSIRVPAAEGGAYAFAGIAKPQRFFSDLERAGCRLTGRRIFRDHQPYSPKVLGDIDRAARESGAAMILTTSKDAVRLPASAASGFSRTSLPILAVPLEVSIEPSFRAWLRGRLNAIRTA